MIRHTTIVDVIIEYNMCETVISIALDSVGNLDVQYESYNTNAAPCGSPSQPVHESCTHCVPSTTNVVEVMLSTESTPLSSNCDNVTVTSSTQATNSQPCREVKESAVEAETDNVEEVDDDFIENYYCIRHYSEVEEEGDEEDIFVTDKYDDYADDYLDGCAQFKRFRYGNVLRASSGYTRPGYQRKDRRRRKTPRQERLKERKEEWNTQCPSRKRDVTTQHVYHNNWPNERKPITYATQDSNWVDVRPYNGGVVEPTEDVKKRTLEAEQRRIAQEEQRLFQQRSREARAVRPTTLQQLLDQLQYRDATPEDYQLLLELDESVAPKTTKQSVLDTIPKRYVSQQLCLDIENESCGVCLNGFEEGDTLRQLQTCNHLFHNACLEKWLTQYSTVCPLDSLRIS